MAGTFTLTSGSYDGRYMQLVCTQTKDVATNKSTISWTLSSIGGSDPHYSTGPTSVTINGTTVYYKDRVKWDDRVFPAAKGSTSGTITVDHNGDGKKSISVSMTTAIYTGTTSTSSDTWTLDSIPRQATITSAPDFTDLDNPTITYSNPAGSAVAALDACISFTGAKDDIAYRAISEAGSSYTFTLTDAERKVLRNNTTGPSRSVIFYVRTIIGGVMYHSTLSKTLTIKESNDTKPSVSMSVTLNNSSLPSAFSGLYIQGKSKVNVSLSATGKYGANIQSYSASIDGKAYSGNPITSDAIQNSGSIKIVGYAKDSRGFTGSTEQTISVVEYSKPQVIPIGSENSILCYRSDGNGKRVGNSTSVWIKAKRSYYSLSGKNGCKLQWRSKKATESWNDGHSWNNLIASTATTTDEYNALIPGTFDLKESYTIQIMAIDDIGESDIKTFEIPTQDVALHLGKGGKNVAIGTYCDYAQEHTFHSEWDATFAKSINGLYMATKYIVSTQKGYIKTKYADFSANGQERQSFFIFGTANGIGTYGLGMVSNNGSTSWTGTTGVVLTAVEDGVVELTLPTIAYDMFVIISAAPIKFV